MESAEILTELRRQTLWLRFMALPRMGEALASVLDDDRKKRVYELTDGARTSREVGAAAGLSHPTVLRWWDQWSRLGLTEGDPGSGRPRKLVSLADVGLEVAEANKPGSREG